MSSLPYMGNVSKLILVSNVCKDVRWDGGIGRLHRLPYLPYKFKTGNPCFWEREIGASYIGNLCSLEVI